MTIDIDREPWMAEANCEGLIDLMFPHRGEDVRPAKAVCAECGVREICLAYALEHHEHWGIWGGLTERERHRIRERRRRSARVMGPGTGVRLGGKGSGPGAAQTAPTRGPSLRERHEHG